MSSEVIDNLYFMSSTSVHSTATKYWMKKTTNATFGIDKWGIGAGRFPTDSRWRRCIFVSVSRKSDRSFIGAFLPDLFSEIKQVFLYISNSSVDGPVQTRPSRRTLLQSDQFLSCASRNLKSF